MPGLSDDIQRFEAYQKGMNALGRMFLDVHPESDFEAISDLAAALIWSGETRQTVLDAAKQVKPLLYWYQKLEAPRA